MNVFYLLIILVGALSWNQLIPGYGGSVLTLLKGLMLITVIFLILVRGIKISNITVFSLIGIAVLTFFCLIQVGRYNFVEYANLGDLLKSYSAYLLLFLLLLLRLTKSEVSSLLKIIQVLPSVSVIVGILLTVITKWNFLKIEYTGVPRLQGSNPPAHLAEICFVAIITSIVVLEYIGKNNMNNSTISKRFPICFLYINIVILVLTFTRITILGVGLIMGYYFIKRIYFSFKKNRFHPINIIIITVMIIPLFYFINIALDLIKQRSLNDLGGINTSGRYWAWKYFLEMASEYKMLGRGLGASQSLYEVNPYKEFVAPHNEYIRSYLEVGTVGIIIMLFFVIIYIIYIFRKNRRGSILNNSLLFIIFISIGLVAYYDNLFVTIHFSLPFLLINTCFLNLNNRKIN